MIRSYLKKVFWPPPWRIGASFKILQILEYACGFKLGPAANLNQNPFLEMASGKAICIILFCLLSIGLAGCVKQTPVEVPVESREKISRAEPERPGAPAGPSPRAQASLKLTDQGRRLIEAGKTDNAISILEQAISLNPSNGQNYYYLSEAWLTKGFAAEARPFNRLAQSHLKGDKDWEQLVTRQAERIAELEEKIKKSR
jgi:tetratricopeptide (TPR) repeat protein